MSAIAAPLHLMTESVTIQRNTESVDASRSPKRAWSNHIADISARVTPKSGSDGFAGGGQRQRLSYTVIVEAGQDILGTDRVKWIKDGVTRYLKIIGPPRDGSGMGAITIIEGEESDPQ